MRKAPTFFVSLALLAVLFAGCSADPVDPDTPDTPKPGKVVVTETTGGIRGVVVDSAITPISGAAVSVLNTNHAMETDANGLFVFSGLDEGTYFVEATHPLYDSQQTSVEVVAGVEEPEAVKIQLSRLINTDPFMETQDFKGYIVCSTNVAVVGYSEECGEGVGYPCDYGLPEDPSGTYECGERIGRQGNSQPQIFFRTTATPVKTFVIEQSWDASLSVATGQTEAFWTRLAWDWVCDPGCGGTSFGSVTSESPLLLRVDAERIADVEESKGPVTPESDLSTFVYSGADNGVILEQPYEQFVSIFYSLEAPEGWSFIGGSTNPYVQ